MNAKEIKKIIADHATLETANAELKHRADKLAEALREMIPFKKLARLFDVDIALMTMRLAQIYGVKP